MNRLVSSLAWLGVALLGAGALGAIAFSRGEPVNGVFFVVAAGCTYLVAYRFYSAFLAARVLSLDATRATPAERLDDGRDFVPTNRWVVLGHHFAAIAGPGPLVGPTLAAQFGYLPGTLWLVVGAVLGGCVQDFVILFFSLRRDGRSLGQIARDEVGRRAGLLAMVSVLAIMVILLAVIALVFVNALKASPWGVFTIASTIPIAMLMGLYMRFWRPGRVMEASGIGFVLILLAVVAGQSVARSPEWAPFFTLTGATLATLVILYGFAASALPVWLLLAPRDYLSAFIKVGVVLALAAGIVLVRPSIQMPALTRFVDGTGPVFAGTIFPFCFITIACGAVSGFHALISSGTTPKLLTRESDARLVGYGSMLMESFVGVMAMVAACALEPGVYFAINSPAGIVGATAEQAARAISGWGFPLDAATMHRLAQSVGEETLLNRTGGAPSLAVGMAHIFSGTIGGERLLGIWYHFAIMFEALFILTVLDAGTRVGRFMVQELLGRLVPRAARTRSWTSTLVTSGLIVGAWGYFLYQGVLDPLRDLEPDPRLRRPRGRNHHPHQDGADPLRVGDARAHRVARDSHAHRQLAEGLPREPADRLPGPSPGPRAAGHRRRTAGGQEGGSAARRLQQPSRRCSDRVLRPSGSRAPRRGGAGLAPDPDAAEAGAPHREPVRQDQVGGALAVRMWALLRVLWLRLREWSGDAAYETYVARMGGGEHPSRRAFYLDSVRRRYRHPNRCC
jgi:carbon starvation protein